MDKQDYIKCIQELRISTVCIDEFYNCIFRQAQRLEKFLVGKQVSVKGKKGLLSCIDVEIYCFSGWRYRIFLDKYKRPIFVFPSSIDEIKILD